MKEKNAAFSHIKPYVHVIRLPIFCSATLNIKKSILYNQKVYAFRVRFAVLQVK